MQLIVKMERDFSHSSLPNQAQQALDAIRYEHLEILANTREHQSTLLHLVVSQQELTQVIKNHLLPWEVLDSVHIDWVADIPVYNELYDVVGWERPSVVPPTHRVAGQ
jgi:hypothetical protein